MGKKKRKKKWYWRGQEKEVLKRFFYLGLQANNSVKVHIDTQTAKTNAIVRKIWEIGVKLGKITVKGELII